MRIGVLALQGDFAEHIQILSNIGAQTSEVRLPDHLKDIDGLIIPGGESTTIGKLALQYGLIEPIRELSKKKPVWGTCAGAIFLSKDVEHEQSTLGLMDMTVRRNAFGRQVDSFEIDLEIPAVANPVNSRAMHCIFIRAPLIEKVGKDVEVLARLPDGCIVAVRQGNLLATSFHPELTGDDRFHRYFLSLVKRIEN